MNRFLSWFAWALLVASFSVAPALAADPPKADPEKLFKRLDTNSDGKLSLEEFIGKRTGDEAERAKENFPKIDKDKDGFLSLEEFKAVLGKKK